MYVHVAEHDLHAPAFARFSAVLRPGLIAGSPGELDAGAARLGTLGPVRPLGPASV